LAIGTSAGTIFFYSFTKSELLAQTKEGHSGPISGLVWNPSTLSLYSCGEDGFIIEWDTENVKPLRYLKKYIYLFS
jgi:WD40 repeat protein